ncbi:MAG: AAA family ATPase [Gammaproteobacteria bacterium]|uniref:AAA family ATPase n=1 Tax=SAR86 cluster bacterium TaxID=2030880 RepID=A0A520N151_9GAMM|nr:AAA family ATPase [SAR86 cluster bacterium]RZO27207.1 MAG: AAA family ATPase [SAR86 cluster bacterium]|tara:strand:- start:2130 stop:4349 length:2220 start_codon:yes stop_codon:yes gene_type:complete
MLSKDLENSLNQLFKDCSENHEEFVTIEHLLLVLTEEESSRKIFETLSVDIASLQKEIKEHIKKNVPKVNEKKEIQPTLAFQRVLQRAIFHVQSSGKTEVHGENLLAALFSEKESYAVYILNRRNISRLDVVDYISHGKTASVETEEVTEEPQKTSESYPDFLTNLNSLALDGKIDPLIGREDTTERLFQILGRRRKNNPILVGESGVGKTAIAEGLAKAISEKRCPKIFQDYEIMSLDVGSLVSGTKYRGDFEKKMKSLTEYLQKNEKIILFVDEIHTIIGAGSASGGALDASNLLKPALARGDIRCIGATTYKEYRQIFEKNNSLSRRFQKISIEEPTIDQALKIIEGLKYKFEEYHEVSYSKEAIKSAVELSNKYLQDSKLPDKAIDLIDEAGSRKKLNKKTGNVIRKSDIESLISSITNIPAVQLTATNKENLNNLEGNLKSVIFGQDHAVESVVSAIKTSKAGIGNEDKPICSFLFTGPTGVGKTELTKQMAFFLGIEFTRIDMSEYMEKHTVSKLIGSPPGYVGYEQGGLLTEEINKKQHCVLLLDEIEKAHPDIFNILLQILDYGNLSDSNGRKINFKNTLIVMTSNTGAVEAENDSVGFIEQASDDKYQKAVSKSFTPEFRNRLDGIVNFNKLDNQNLHAVVEKFLIEVQTKLNQKGIDLEYDSNVVEFILQKNTDTKLGARPIARIVEKEVKKPIANLIIEDKAKRGDVVSVELIKNKLKFKAGTKLKVT